MSRYSNGEAQAVPEFRSWPAGDRCGSVGAARTSAVEREVSASAEVEIRLSERVLVGLTSEDTFRAVDRKARGRPGQVLPRPGGGARRRGRERRRRDRGLLRRRARRAASGSARRRASSGSAARSTAEALRRVLDGLRSAGRVGAADVVEPGAGGRLRPDVLGAEERERAVRARRRASCGRAFVRLMTSRCGRRSATWRGRPRRFGAGMAGAIVEEASGLVAAAFRHRTSRAGDPQLHTHVLVANLGRGRRRAVVGAGRPAAVRAGADGELRLPGGAARRADADARRGVVAGRKWIAEVVGVRRRVLAGQGIDREWAYVALSRGRHTNRLYVAALQLDDGRAEFAPLARGTVDPIERLARQLQRSTAQVLAIDTRRPLDADASEPERRRRLRWLPGRRREPLAVDDRRDHAETQHGWIRSRRKPSSTRARLAATRSSPTAKQSGCCNWSVGSDGRCDGASAETRALRRRGRQSRGGAGRAHRVEPVCDGALVELLEAACRTRRAGPGVHGRLARRGSAGLAQGGARRDRARRAGGGQARRPLDHLGRRRTRVGASTSATPPIARAARAAPRGGAARLGDRPAAGGESGAAVAYDLL